MYIFLSGAGTGKSRNAAELHQTTYKCFNGHYFQRNEKLAILILGAFVFHVSFENGTSILPSLSLDVHARFHPPAPLALTRFFAKQNTERVFFLGVDGLKNVQDIFGETILMQTLTALGDLAKIECKGNSAGVGSNISLNIPNDRFYQFFKELAFALRQVKLMIQVP